MVTTIFRAQVVMRYVVMFYLLMAAWLHGQDSVFFDATVQWYHWWYVVLAVPTVLVPTDWLITSDAPQRQRLTRKYWKYWISFMIFCFTCGYSVRISYNIDAFEDDFKGSCIAIDNQDDDASNNLNCQSYLVEAMPYLAYAQVGMFSVIGLAAAGAAGVDFVHVAVLAMLQFLYCVLQLWWFGFEPNSEIMPFFASSCLLCFTNYFRDRNIRNSYMRHKEELKEFRSEVNDLLDLLDNKDEDLDVFQV
jgi:hypothetical protein